ncbi:DUF3494 domain-containing protein [Hymenobacter sp. BT683]|uniref:DUF3494 domain-containing protein n=2 Tax=Hymenobacter jeongseonensis TaxID=2791027 RepID=A0ABS0INQ6_9BACT|nr:DUF3494 domain-containing protein [Hymenobacter jeongseonensis]
MSLLAGAGTQECFAQAVQAPTLGAAATYGLLTISGNLDNTGSTTAIVGDIGTGQGTVTGFEPIMYTGELHNPASEDAIKGVSDAYSYLAEDVVGGTAHGTTLGSETLTKGVYVLNGSSTLTGDLILDGQGDADALFIIKVAGALSTTTPSNVRLINSTSWENVFWHVTGTVSLGADTRFRGTIVANDDITLLANAVLQGRALTQAGDITLSSNTVTTSQVYLPVELTSFTAERRGEQALLRWSTATERNNVYFAVQSSSDGLKYTTIGKVKGQGTTSMSHVYAWTDTRADRYPAGVIYYRLAQVDTDSSKHYSPVRTITAAPLAGLQVQVYPSPSQLPCSLRINAKQAGSATLRLTDGLGRLVAQHQHQLLAGSNWLPLEEATTLAPGVYQVQVQQGAVRQTVRLVRE